MSNSDILRPVLVIEGEYWIERFYEDASLVWHGGGIDIGDHYGDPNGAVRNAIASWCVTGGEDLMICQFEVGLPKGAARFPANCLERAVIPGP